VGSAGISGGSASYVSLSIDGNTLIPYVGYLDSNSNNADVVSYDGASWGNLLFNMSSGTPQYVSIAASSNLDSRVYAAFYDPTVNTSVVKYYDNSSSTKGSLSGSAFTKNGGEMIGKYGSTVYLAFFDAATRYGWVLSNSGSGWTTVGGGPFYTNCDSYITLWVDQSSNTPYVAYDDLTNHNISVKCVSGLGSWINVGTPGFNQIYPTLGESLSLYAFGSTIYLAFNNAATGNGEVWQNVSGTWVRVGGVGFAGQADYISLAVYSGNPYVGFSDGNHSSGPSVMTYSGGSWKYVGLPGFTGSGCTYTSLAIVGTWPYLAFSDGAQGGKLSVYENY
jgi:hypothetical protein